MDIPSAVLPPSVRPDASPRTARAPAAPERRLKERRGEVQAPFRPWKDRGRGRSGASDYDSWGRAPGTGVDHASPPTLGDICRDETPSWPVAPRRAGTATATAGSADPAGGRRSEYIRGSAATRGATHGQHGSRPHHRP